MEPGIASCLINLAFDQVNAGPELTAKSAKMSEGSFGRSTDADAQPWDSAARASREVRAGDLGNRVTDSYFPAEPLAGSKRRALRQPPLPIRRRQSERRERTLPASLTEDFW